MQTFPYAGQVPFLPIQLHTLSVAQCAKWVVVSVAPRTELSERSVKGVSAWCRFQSHWGGFRLTAQAPAAVATSPPDIIICLGPLVLLNIIPLKAPAATLFAASSSLLSVVPLAVF